LDKELPVKVMMQQMVIRRINDDDETYQVDEPFLFSSAALCTSKYLDELI